jgi:hypothetical protein
MSAFKAWTVSVGLLLAATAANAQGLPPQDTGRSGYIVASDIAEPYADVPPPPRVIYGSPGPAYGYGPGGYRPGPAYRYEYGGVGGELLPPREVYAVLRQSGFQPLGMPRLRGMVYIVEAMDRRGEDGRLMIDARTGQIMRFMPAYRLGDNFDGRYAPPVYGPPPISRLDAPALPPTSHLDSQMPPPAPAAKMASRMPSAVPAPKAAPQRPNIDQPLAAKPTLAPAPTQQSAAVQMKPADTPSAAPAAPLAEVKPVAPAIQATQPMPKVQDLE